MIDVESACGTDQPPRRRRPTAIPTANTAIVTNADLVGCVGALASSRAARNVINKTLRLYHQHHLLVITEKRMNLAFGS
jgi:hypothetical protein